MDDKNYFLADTVPGRPWDEEASLARLIRVGIRPSVGDHNFTWIITRSRRIRELRGCGAGGLLSLLASRDCLW